MNIGVILIATRKYSVFLDALLPGIRAHFLRRHHVTIHLFSDKDLSLGDDVVVHSVPEWGWPDATLRRYEAMTMDAGLLLKEDYLFYMDVDSMVVDIVGDDILQPLVATVHPGYYARGGGTWEMDAVSTAYVPPVRRKVYVAGGFQGGESERYLWAAWRMYQAIEEDRQKGITAVWHDESHWNAYVSRQVSVTLLTPAYCYPSADLAASWGLGDVHPRILALDKHHEKMRS